MQYHHQVSGLACVKSWYDYEIQHDMHVQEYYWRMIKVERVGYDLDGSAVFQSTFGDYDLDCKTALGNTKQEAKEELMATMGW